MPLKFNYGLILRSMFQESTQNKQEFSRRSFRPLLSPLAKCIIRGIMLHKKLGNACKKADLAGEYETWLVAGGTPATRGSPKPLLRVRVLLPLPWELFLKRKGSFSISLTQEQNTSRRIHLRINVHKYCMSHWRRRDQGALTAPWHSRPYNSSS